MPIQLSPSVVTRETDLTTIVPGISTSEAAVAGEFNWGPVMTSILVDSENELVRTFGKPSNRNADDWWTSANFLAYANKLHVVRVVDDTNDDEALRAKNAASGTAFLVRNDDEYETKYSDGQLAQNHSTGPWIAKYPGERGNSIGISVCSSASAYSSTPAGTVTVVSGERTVTGTGTNFLDEIRIGDFITVGNQTLQVTSIDSDTTLTVRSRHIIGATDVGFTRNWRFSNSVGLAPGSSDRAESVDGENDELHIVFYDRDGQWTGQKGTVIESYQFVSQARDARTANNTNNYYKEVINRDSRVVRWAGHDGVFADAGKSSSTSFATSDLPLDYELSGGNNGSSVTENEKIPGYNKFLDKEGIDVSFILGSSASQTLAIHLINNIAETRNDCVVFLSPPKAACVDNIDNEAADIVAFRNQLPSTSWAALDGNWKYQYDVYNDVYRYVPLNGDIAGLHARTDLNRDSWWAAGGFNRGHIKNAIRLGWNPQIADRNELYKNGINPATVFKGEGAVFLGNKTLQSKPSAFDRLNVRRLFITLRKSISKAARYTLFEFNDEFTRASFRNLVEPFLRDVQGRRGIFDFEVVCDESNNTPIVIDRNEFKADIYIKPARVAENIDLNFVATPTGVTFDEVVGRSG